MATSYFSVKILKSFNNVHPTQHAVNMDREGIIALMDNGKVFFYQRHVTRNQQTVEVEITKKFETVKDAKEYLTCTNSLPADCHIRNIFAERFGFEFTDLFLN